jgi:hypothetical protein
MTNTYSNYFTEIEEHFRRTRGTGLFLLSPRDLALIEEWKRAGVPLEAVLRGIDVTFKKWWKRPAQARINRINSLAYCTQAIMAEAQLMVNAAPVGPTSSASPFSSNEIRSFVLGNAAMLRKAGYDDLGQSLEALDLDSLCNDLESLEQKLTEIEEKMIIRIRSTVSEGIRLAVRRELDMDLKPYRGKMTADQLVLLETQFIDRRLRELSGLPRLSLFYLP